MRRSEKINEELIELIYACLLGEAKWQQFLGRLNKLVPDGGSTLFFHDQTRSAGGATLATGFETSALRDYALYYSGLNPWMREAARIPLGIGVIGEQVVDRDVFVGTEYYNDFVRPHGMESGIGATIFRDAGCSFTLSTLTSRIDTEENSQVARTFTSLVPHLRRAFRFYRDGPISAAAIDLNGSLFDAVDIGLVIVGEELRIRTTSQAGEKFLADGNVMGVNPVGKLAFRDNVANALLKQMLSRHYNSNLVECLTIGSNKLTFIRWIQDDVREYFAGPTVAILIEPTSARSRPPDIDELVRRFRLSPSERRVFAGIVAGKRVYEIADEAGIGRETVRTQLKDVYAKTGVNSQSALVRIAFANEDLQ
ncbi:MAG: helix-turn-helix transcriptional regulator [Pseudaminobacter sp.]